MLAKIRTLAALAAVFMVGGCGGGGGGGGTPAPLVTLGGTLQRAAARAPQGRALATLPRTETVWIGAIDETGVAAAAHTLGAGDSAFVLTVPSGHDYVLEFRKDDAAGPTLATLVIVPEETPPRRVFTLPAGSLDVEFGTIDVQPLTGRAVSSNDLGATLAAPAASPLLTDTDGDGVPDVAQRGVTDNDADGVKNADDKFPFNPAASADTDGDGFPDRWNANATPDLIAASTNSDITLDAFPNDPKEAKDSDGDGVGDNSDAFPHTLAASVDTDHDGLPDKWNDRATQAQIAVSNLVLDNCPAVANAAQKDSDGDGLGDACDDCPLVANPGQEPSACQTAQGQPDSDGDKVADAVDNCPNVFNSDQKDTDKDGIGDACDNCPTVANPGQNANACAIPPVDTDGDGIPDAIDNCLAVANHDQADTDADGVGNVCDNCPAAANLAQTDTDGDGVGDVCDNCAAVANANQADGDADGPGDVCDNCPAVANPAQEDLLSPDPLLPATTVAGADGIGDVCEPTPGANAYTWIANAPLVITEPALKVLANGKFVDPAGIVDYNPATTLGGTVTMAADGALLYTPPIGFAGPFPATDTFNYRAKSSIRPGVAAWNTVTVTLPSAARFVQNNSVAAVADGTLATPFKTLAAAQTASLPGDTIFVFTGDQLETGQNAGILLKANQKLLGQGLPFMYSGFVANGAPAPKAIMIPNPVPAGTPVLPGGAPVVAAGSIAGAAVLPLVPIARPVITNPAGGGAGVTLANANEVAGVQIGRLAGGVNQQGIRGLPGTVDGFNIHDNRIINTTAEGIRIIDPLTALAPGLIANNSFSGTAGGGILVDSGNGGVTPGGTVTLSVTGNTVTNAGGAEAAIEVLATGSAANVTATLSGNTVTGGTPDGIRVRSGVRAGAQASLLTATIANNTVTATTGNGIVVEAFAASHTVLSTVTGNTSSGSTANSGIQIRTDNSATMDLFSGVSGNTFNTNRQSGMNIQTLATSKMVLTLDRNIATGNTASGIVMDAAGGSLSAAVGTALTGNALGGNTALALDAKTTVAAGTLCVQLAGNSGAVLQLTKGPGTFQIEAADAAAVQAANPNGTVAFVPANLVGFTFGATCNFAAPF